jgi:predicted HicB family RNase H-like nuclease
MSKPTKKSQKTPKSENQNPDTATQESSPTKPKGSHGDKRILSIAIDPALHSRLALLARAEGVSVTQLVVDAVSRNLKARITAALEALKAEIE